jgi:hypothetical protein
VTTAITSVTLEPYRVAVAVTTDVTPVVAWQLNREYRGTTETVRGDGTPWSVFNASGQARTLYDVEAPRGVALTYHVAAIRSDGTTDWSPPSSPVTLDAAGDCHWWAAPLTLPRLTVEFEPETQHDQVYAAANGVFRATGRPDPIVLFGTRQTATGDLAARCADYEAATTLRQAVGDSEVMVIRAPAPVGWSPSGRRYVAVDTIQLHRIISEPLTPYTVALPWLEVRPPLVSVIGWGATWTEVAAGFATWTAVVSAFPSWDGLLGWVP